MAASCPPPSVIPRAIRRIPCHGRSCLPNTGSWGAVCYRRTGSMRSPSACAVWSPSRTWRYSGVCSVLLRPQTRNAAARTRVLTARTVGALATVGAAPAVGRTPRQYGGGGAHGQINLHPPPYWGGGGGLAP